MKFETLETANIINKKIKELDDVLDCFEWDEPELSPNLSRNPSIIIEFDDLEGDRSEIKVPMVLSNQFIQLIKKEVLSERNRLLSEFNDL